MLPGEDKMSIISLNHKKNVDSGTTICRFCFLLLPVGIIVRTLSINGIAMNQEAMR